MSLAPGPLLPGKITVVTGAGHGMGRAIALAFGAHGATVVIAGRDSDALSQTADSIAASGGKVIPVVADVTRRADVRRLAELAGEVDVLVNHVGPPEAIAQPFLETNEDDWEGLYDSTLKPVLLSCRAMVPGMIVRDRGGSVINVTVQSAFDGGVTRFTKSLAKELGRHRIRVNTVRVPPSRRGQSEDLAGAALFLASDLSTLVTGTAIRINGEDGSEPF
jgi:3-oxoacyl-[acyl-carrier protein] reductase